AHDPELPELALANLAVAVRVRERTLDLFLRVLVVGALEAPVALRLLENLAALLLGVDCALDTRHRSAPSQHPFACLRVRRVDRKQLTERPLLLRRLVLQVVALVGRPAQEPSRPGHLELLCRS